MKSPQGNGESPSNGASEPGGKKMDTGSIPQRGFIKPQRVWKWEIAIYLFLAGMGAGSYIIGMAAHWILHPRGDTTILGFNIDLARLALFWGPILVAVGAPFLILDLGIKRRFLYACLNPKTSWVARGFLILSAFIVLGLIVLGISTLFPQLPPTLSPFWLILEIVTFVFAFATVIYTGILLKSVKYVPIWNTPFLPTLFLASGLSTGSMGIILSTMGAGLLFSKGGMFVSLAHEIVPVERILILTEGLILALYLYSRYRVKDQGETSVRLLVSGNLRSLFWGGIVFTGFAFPFALEYTYSCCPDYPVLLFITGLFLLFGGFFLRLGLLASGIREQIPMHKVIEIKANLRVP
jgi:polysulfide reductase chain C